MYGYIYLTTDIHTGKIYIGKKHSFQFLGIKYIGSGKIITDIKKHCLKNGIDLNKRFSVELLAECDSLQELNEKEIYFIEKFDSRNPEIGYNLRKGGDCGPGGPNFKGHRHSKETRLAFSKNRTGCKNSNYGNRWKQSDELKRLHSRLSSGCGNGMYGKTHSIETKEKIRNVHLGKIAISNLSTDCVKMINKESFSEYEKLGWIKGNIHKNKIQVI